MPSLDNSTAQTWNNPPTPITPGANRHASAHSSNPFAAGRFQNTLKSSHRPSPINQTTAQSLRSSNSHKRQKIDHTFNSSALRPIRGTPRSRQVKKSTEAQEHALKLREAQETIVVSSEDEDIGVPLKKSNVGDYREEQSVDSDPLNLLPDVLEVASERSKSPQARKSASRPTYSGTCSDPIEQSSDSEPTKPRKSGRVTELVQEFERKGQAKDRSPPKKPQGLLDLSRVSEPKPSQKIKGSAGKLNKIPMVMTRVGSAAKTSNPLAKTSNLLANDSGPVLPISTWFDLKGRRDPDLIYFLGWSPERDRLAITAHQDGKIVRHLIIYEKQGQITCQMVEKASGKPRLLFRQKIKKKGSDPEFFAIELDLEGVRDGAKKYEKLIQHIRSGFGTLKLDMIDEHAAKSLWESWGGSMAQEYHGSDLNRAESIGESSISSVSQLQSKQSKRPRSPSQVLISDDDIPPVSAITAPLSEVVNKPTRSSPGQPISAPGSTRPTPKAVTTYGGPRRSARQQAAVTSSSSSGNTTKTPLANPDEVVLSYPPGAGAVNITAADVERLQPGEFLNDNLIEFGLKLWLKELESSNPELASQIHVFSSFFYKKINIKNFDEGYQSVRKWTSKFDFFKKKYIIVPINENLHWYLAIIHKPEFTLEPPLPPSPSKAKQPTRKSLRGAAAETIAEPSNPRILVEENVPPKEEVEIVPSATDVDNQSRSSPGMSEVEELLTKSQLSNEGTPPKMKPIDLHEVMDVDEDDAQSISTALMSKSRSREDSVVPETDLEDEHGSTVAEPPTQKPDLVPDMDLLYPPTSPMHVDATLAPAAEDEAREQEPIVADSISGAVPPARFYNTQGGQTKAPPTVVEVEDMDVDVLNGTDQGAGITGEAETTASAPVEEFNDDNVTYIFTLDSLGNRHPQAIKVLTKYLKAEAKDKHSNENPREPKGMGISVPLQTNYCDCGVYLLDFARLFMNDPAGYYAKSKMSHLKAVERRAFWTITQDQRQDLRARIISLSEQWKKEREEKRKLEDKDKPTQVDDSSDSEIEFLQNHDRPVTPKPNKGKGKETRANRLR